VIRGKAIAGSSRYHLLIVDIGGNLVGIHMELEKLLEQEKPILSADLRCQEAKRLYLLIGPVLPVSLLRKVGMSPILLRSLVLHLLRQSGSPLGAESQFDRWFSKWMMRLR
jgi:hypothetical protein